MTLKEARKAARLSQREAAHLLDIAVPTLYNYEAGLFYPTVPIIKRIEKVYGIKYDEIEWGL